MATIIMSITGVSSPGIINNSRMAKFRPVCIVVFISFRSLFFVGSGDCLAKIGSAEFDAAAMAAVTAVQMPMRPDKKSEIVNLQVRMKEQDDG